MGLPLDAISTTSQKCIACFKVAQHNFPCTSNVGLGTNRHGNMSCFNGGLAPILDGWKPCTLKHEPQHLPPTETCQVSTGDPTRVLMPNSPSPQNISPLKCVKFWELCFSPMCPSSMFPHAIPIHDILDLFQLFNTLSNFHWITLSRQLMKVME
jgi:hypothetical protein